MTAVGNVIMKPINKLSVFDYLIIYYFYYNLKIIHKQKESSHTKLPHGSLSAGSTFLFNKHNII